MARLDPRHVAFHPLAVAARELDGDAEEVGIEETYVRSQIDGQVLGLMAEQRAIRIVLQLRGEKIPRLKLDQRVDVTLLPAEVTLFKVICAAYYDGVQIGWRARRIEEGKDA